MFMRDLSPIKKKIIQVLDFKGLTRYQFYKESGMTRGVLDKESGISEDNIAKFIAYFPEVNLDWLLKDKGEIFQLNQNNYSRVSEEKAGYKGSKKSIPLIPIEAMAGMGGGNVSIAEEDILDRYVIPDFTDVDFMIRIKGSSMEPNFNSGDVIACKIIQERSFFQWGRVFVLHHQEQGTMVKRLFPDLEKGSVECKSDNPKYPAFTLSLKEVTNIALVKGVIRLE
jgi:phage repressor protein C with HTH and peptisase S24 domain